MNHTWKAPGISEVGWNHPIDRDGIINVFYGNCLNCKKTIFVEQFIPREEMVIRSPYHLEELKKRLLEEAKIALNDGRCPPNPEDEVKYTWV